VLLLLLLLAAAHAAADAAAACAAIAAADAHVAAVSCGRLQPWSVVGHYWLLLVDVTVSSRGQ